MTRARPTQSRRSLVPPPAPRHSTASTRRSGVRPCLEAHRIVAAQNVAVADHHVVAAGDVHAVVVGAHQVAGQFHAPDPHAVVVQRVQGPSAGVCQVYVLDPRVLRVAQFDHRARAAVVRVHGTDPGQTAAPGVGRMGGVLLEARRARQHGSGHQIEDGVRSQEDRAGHERARRHPAPPGWPGCSVLPRRLPRRGG